MLAYFYPPVVAGGEVILRQTSRALVRRGHSVSVHVTDFGDLALTRRVQAPPREEDEGVRVVRHRARRLPDPNPLEKSCWAPGLRTALREPADLLVVHGYPSQQLGLAVRDGRPFVVQNYLTGQDVAALAQPDSRRRWLRAQIWRRQVVPQLARARALIVDTRAAFDGLQALYGLDNLTLHPGSMVEPDELDPERPTDRAGVSVDEVLVLAPSRVARMKGLDLLARALHHLPAHFRGVAVGPVEDPALLADALALAPPGRLVHVERSREEFLGLLGSADVVVLPSRGEASGGVAMEALALGVPTVVSERVENARDLYGAQAVLVNPDDPVALAGALEEALARPQSHWRQARAFLRRHFAVERSVDRLERIYATALDGGDVARAGWT